MGFFLTLLVLAIVFTAQQLLAEPPEFENAKPAGLGDFQFPTASQDRVKPLIFGTVRQKGPNVTWYGDLEQRAITERIKVSLIKKETVVRGFQYDVGIKFSICRGNTTTGVELRRVWVGEEEVFNGSILGEGFFDIDLPEFFGGNELGNGGLIGRVSWRPGTEAQTVNTYLDSTGELKVPITTGTTPRDIGTAFATFEKGYIGNSAQNIRPWSFEVREIVNGLGLALADVNSGNDASIPNVIYEGLTNQEWGRKFAPSDIDTVNFAAAAATLRAEGNGFSYMLDRQQALSQLFDICMEQADGILYLDHRVGLWRINLARGGYDINTIPAITVANPPIAVTAYSTGDWAATTNEILVTFSDRQQDYLQTTAPAHDSGGHILVGGGTVTTGIAVVAPKQYPGVKDATLADNIAWRDLDTVSVPLKHASVEVDRTLWEVTPGSVISWEDPVRELPKTAFRVKSINYGTFEDQSIKMEIVEDIFQFITGSFGAPGGSQWTPPKKLTNAAPADEQIAYEAPRGFVLRSDVSSIQSLLFGAVRRQPAAVSFSLNERHPAGGGAYTDQGEGYGFVFIGELANALGTGSVPPLASLLLNATPDQQATLEASFTDTSDLVDLGTNFVNIIQVGEEFMLCTGAQTSGLQVQLNQIYRNVMDVGQLDHAAGTRVYLLHEGGLTSLSAIPDTTTVDVKLLPRSPAARVPEAAATLINFTMDKRVRRPNCPGRMSLETVVYKVSASLEGAGSTPEDFGIDLSFVRRDYRTVDEIQALTVDAGTLFNDFPAANITTVEVEVIDDPAGSATSLFTDTGISAASHVPLRIAILAATNGVLPTTLRLALRQRHTDGGEILLSRGELRHDFTVTSALTGDFPFGARGLAVTSNTYTADAAGVHAFSLSTATTVGAVEISVNLAAFVSLIPQGSTVAPSPPNLSVSDTVRLRHQSTDAGLLKQVSMAAPGVDGYFILIP